MKFERARTPETKQIRMNQVKQAAIKLFDTTPYQDITLSKIAELLDFNRANLYKYVKSKEDIYIHVFIDELNNYIVDLENGFAGNRKYACGEVADILTGTYMRHRLFLKLFPLIFSTIEEKTDFDLLVEFKNNYAEIRKREIKVFLHLFPDKAEKEVDEFITYINSFLIGFIKLTDPSDYQKKVFAELDTPVRIPEFYPNLHQMILILIKGTLK